MKRVVEALKYAVFGGGSKIQGRDRALLVEKALRVLQLSEDREVSEAAQLAYEQAMAELHAFITPQVVITLAVANYLPAIGPSAAGVWVHPYAEGLKIFARRLSHDFGAAHDRLDLQREVIHRAHLALMDVGAFFGPRGDDVRDGIANAIRQVGRERDEAKEERDAYREELQASVARELEFRQALAEARSGANELRERERPQPEIEQAEAGA